MQNSLSLNATHEPTVTWPSDIACREFAGLADLLNGIAALPRLVRLLEEQALAIKALTAEVKALRSGPQGTTDGWPDAKGAAKYLSRCDQTWTRCNQTWTARAIKRGRSGFARVFRSRSVAKAEENLRLRLFPCTFQR
jgi:hypothetical protein